MSNIRRIFIYSLPQKTGEFFVVRRVKNKIQHEFIIDIKKIFDKYIKEISDNQNPVILCHKISSKKIQCSKIIISFFKRLVIHLATCINKLSLFIAWFYSRFRNKLNRKNYVRPSIYRVMHCINTTNSSCIATCYGVCKKKQEEIDSCLFLPVLNSSNYHFCL